MCSFFPPAKAYGGPIESNYHLCRSLSLLGAHVHVITVGADGDKDLDVPLNQWTNFGELPVFYARRLGRSAIAPHVWCGAGRAWESSDVVHISGSFSLELPFVALRSGRRGLPLVYTPRGVFLPEALARKRLRKLAYNCIVGRFAYPRVTVVHATSDVEREATRRLLPRARVAVVPNGVVVPEQTHWPAPRFSSKAGQRYVLYLGRLHPFKQIERVIEAFARANAKPNTELWIAGDGSARYVGELRRASSRFSVGARTRWLGHLEGKDKSSVLAHADVLVLASRSENFGLSVAEALAHGTPCVASCRGPWERLTAEGCGYWVSDGAANLAGALRTVLNLSVAERRCLGERGRAWMRREFAWPAVARRMLSVYSDAQRLAACTADLSQGSA